MDDVFLKNKFSESLRSISPIYITFYKSKKILCYFLRLNPFMKHIQNRNSKIVYILRERSVLFGWWIPSIHLSIIILLLANINDNQNQNTQLLMQTHRSWSIRYIFYGEYDDWNSKWIILIVSKYLAFIYKPDFMCQSF